MKRLSIIFLALCALAISCNRNEEDIPTILDDVQYDVHETVDNLAFFMSGAADGCLNEAIQQRFTGAAASKDDAKIIFLRTSDLEANTAFLQEFLGKGGVLIELDPDLAAHREWFDKAGIPTATGETKLSVLATCGLDTYMLDDIFSDMETGDGSGNPELSSEKGSESKEDHKTNNDVNVLEQGKTVEYCSVMINPLVAWVNRQLDEDNPLQGPKNVFGSSTAVPDIVDLTDYKSLVSNSKYTQHITKSQKIVYSNYVISSVILSDDDVVSRTSTVEFEFDITRFYAYNETNSAGVGGDYYFVNAKATTYNEPMCKNYRMWHGAVVTHAHAFYLKDMRLNAKLCGVERSGGTIKAISMPSQYKVAFEKRPMPETTSSSSSYSSGFTWDINANGQAGYMKGPVGTITIGTKLSWNSSETHSMPDMSIEMNTTAGTGEVGYHFKTNNVQEKDDINAAIPAIARTTRTDCASWVWHVQNTQDDDETTSFGILIKANPQYAWIHRHATWAAEGYSSVADDRANTWHLFELTAPDRVRRGIISLKNTFDGNRYLDTMVITDQDGNIVGEYEADTSSESAFHNETIMRQVPVGTYDVTYEIVDGDEGTLYHKFKISNVKVTTAATTNIWAYDGKIVE